MICRGRTLAFGVWIKIFEDYHGAILSLAKLFDRVPEKNLPPIPLDDESPSVKELQKQREERGKRAEFLFADLLLSQKTEREKIKKSTASFSLDSINFLCSAEVNNSDADNLQSVNCNSNSDSFEKKFQTVSAICSLKNSFELR